MPSSDSTICARLRFERRSDSQVRPARPRGELQHRQNGCRVEQASRLLPTGLARRWFRSTCRGLCAQPLPGRVGGCWLSLTPNESRMCTSSARDEPKHASGENMAGKSKQGDEMRDHYDFSGGVRGKYAARYAGRNERGGARSRRGRSVSRFNRRKRGSSHAR